MDSFISWIGGKKVLRKKILEEFPSDYDRYIEVFGGAGWILFSKDRHAELEVFNDINGELINLFRCVKYHAQEVQKQLEYTFCSRELFFDCKEQLKVRGLTDIQRAARYFILIKESFGTNIRSFGTKSTNIKKSVEYLSDISERLRSVVIENNDFENILKVYDKENALFYLDPPYVGSEKCYKNPFSEQDHERLKSLLVNLKGKFILSYNDNDWIRKLYDGFNIIELKRRNTLPAHDNCTYYNELIIKNY